MCDEPHPLLIKEMIDHCINGDIDEAYKILKSLWDKGYAAVDIIGNIFRVCKNHQMPEYLKLEFVKVRNVQCGQHNSYGRRDVELKHKDLNL